MKVVVAGNAAQYGNWCRANGINPHNRNEAIYVAQPDTVRGMMFPAEDVEYVGSVYARPDMQRIFDNVNVCIDAYNHKHREKQ